MPVAPGRKPVRLKIQPDRLVVAHFFLPFERNYLLYECVVSGCEHRVGKCPGAGLAGYLYDEGRYLRDQREGTRKARGGPGCPCCTACLLAS